MSCLRRSWLAQIVVLALLAWTAVDLSAAQVCSTDSEPVQVTDRLVVDHPSGAPTPGTISVDDCFCCSHSVQARPIVALNCDWHAGWSVPVAPPLFPPILASVLYHPPQSLA